MGNPLKENGQKDRESVIDAAFQRFHAAASTGRGVRSMLGRRIALLVWPEVFETLDFKDDAVFLEPLLFMAGLIPEIATDLPALLNRQMKSAMLNCRPEFAPAFGYLDLTGKCPVPVRRINGIELLDRGIQGLDTLAGPYDIADPADVARVESAIHFLTAIWPRLFMAVQQACRRIVLFRSKRANSFASESMPGTIFLNLDQGTSLAALLEDLTHQAMHCLFSDVEHGAQLYSKPPGDLLRDHGQMLSGGRSISVLHHSCLTLAASCHGLERALSVATLSATDRLEVQARIGFLCRKMALDLTSARTLDALQPEWSGAFWSLILGLRPQDTYAAWTYATQGYNFRFDAFCAENRIGPSLDLCPHAQQV